MGRPASGQPANVSPPGWSGRFADGPLSVGAAVILALAVLSAAWVAFLPSRDSGHRQVWTFARDHAALYRPIIEARNSRRDPKFDLTLLSIPALERRMLSGFLSGTPTADIIEAERRVAARAFIGPLSSVGFVDLTDRLRAEGFLERFVPQAFTPWSSRGRIFGLPHDVHPVMLGYRADLVEAAGIDVAGIETWDDYARVLRPLMRDADGDGRPDRYLVNFWPKSTVAADHIEVFLLQGGGGFFDAAGRPVLDSEINATILATLISWCVGPDRIAGDAPDFTASGNRLKLEGYVVGSLMPDWMSNLWKAEIPQLAGKVKVMPLPAFERGGRRTSVWGGTMLGIPKSAENFDELWDFAKELYLSPELVRALYTTGGIVTPVREHWSDPVFDEPDPYFSGQPKGRAYIGLADDIPVRHASPYYVIAQARVADAAGGLLDWATANGQFTRADLLPEARRRLAGAQASVLRQMERNVFLKEELAAVAPEAAAAAEPAR